MCNKYNTAKWNSGQHQQLFITVRLLHASDGNKIRINYLYDLGIYRRSNDNCEKTNVSY